MFLQGCSVLPDGFVGRDGAEWRLGTVLLLRHAHAVAMVQKAAVADYEFSDAWSLPGGMVRARDWGDEGAIDPALLLVRSLAGRAEAEAGIALADFKGLGAALEFGPIVSSYTAKGRKRFVLLTVQSGRTASTIPLEPRDPSVQRAAWLGSPIDWARLAPANRVLLAHALWQDLDDAQRDDATSPVMQALQSCGAWGGEMGWARLAAPWDAPEAIAAWRSSWIDLA